MIDAGPSLQAAGKVGASALMDYLVSKGWSAQASKVEGVCVLSKTVPDSDQLVECILPTRPGSADERTRVADALRAVAQMENMTISDVVAAAVRDAIDREDDAPIGAQAVASASGMTTALPAFYDELLIQRVGEGDRAAMLELFGRHQLRVFRFVLRMVRTYEMAEDLTAEVFVQVWREADRFKGHFEVSAWLLAIARLKALEAMRKEERHELNDDVTSEDVTSAIQEAGGTPVIYPQVIGLPPLSATTRRAGTVRFFNDDTRFVLIRPDNGEDVFVPASPKEGAGMRSLVKGQRVEFELKSDATLTITRWLA